MKDNNMIYKILLAIVSVVVIALGIFAYIKQKNIAVQTPNPTTKTDNSADKKINDYKDKFDKETTLENKITVLKSLISAKDKAKSADKDKYNQAQNDLKTKLASFIDEQIKANEIANYNVTTDKEKGSQYKTNLEKLLETLTKEKSVVFTNDEDFAKVEKQIKDLITTYSQEAPAVVEQPQQTVEQPVVQPAAPVVTPQPAVQPTAPVTPPATTQPTTPATSGETNTTTNN